MGDECLVARDQHLQRHLQRRAPGRFVGDPEDDADDHPDEKVDDGPAWVASVVNAIGKSAYWKSSVVVVIWDDWGGFYDNAVPQQFDDAQGGLGFRVPMMVISPYAIAGGGKGGSIAHTQYEFGSILKYIEQNWNLPLARYERRAREEHRAISSTTARRRAPLRKSHPNTTRSTL